MDRSSEQREQLTEEGREAGIPLMKKKKYRAKNGSQQNTSTSGAARGGGHCAMALPLVLDIIMPKPNNCLKIC